MSARAPIFPLLWIFSAVVLPTGVHADQTPAASGDSGPQRPQALLAASIRAVEAHDSISAEIRHEVDLFNRHLVGSGHYWQQRQDGHPLLRLELKIQLGGQTTSLLQVLPPAGPEGQFLWTKRKLLGQPELSRIDVARATEALEKAERTVGPGELGVLPGLGGLSKVLRGLDRAFDFSTAQQGRWGKENRPVWRLQGHWRAEQLIRLLPGQQASIEAGQPPDLSRLAKHLPDHVVLLLGQEDLFPYRIEYRRAAGDRALPSGEPESRALVTMELFDIVLNVPIDPRRFQYTGDAQCTDRTDSFLKSLHVE